MNKPVEEAKPVEKAELKIEWVPGFSLLLIFLAASIILSILLWYLGEVYDFFPINLTRIGVSSLLFLLILITLKKIMLKYSSIHFMFYLFHSYSPM
jgi:hypothetical protein